VTPDEAMERLMNVGAQMANVCFNWSQEANDTGGTLFAKDRAMLASMYRQWDEARHALAASPPAPATPAPSLGAPASPSGSPLQPPAAASAAIPSANAQRAYDPILGVWTSAAAQAEQREQARIDRVVGGLEAAKSASYSPADRAFHSFWYGHMVNDRMTAPLDRISYGVARYVWEAARGMEARRAETAGLGSAGPTARSPNGDAPERESPREPLTEREALNFALARLGSQFPDHPPPTWLKEIEDALRRGLGELPPAGSAQEVN
jgi:hypothetical protein